LEFEEWRFELDVDFNEFICCDADDWDFGDCDVNEVGTNIV